MKIIGLTLSALGLLSGASGESTAARGYPGGGMRVAPAMSLHRVTPARVHASPVGAFRGARRGFVVRPRARLPVAAAIVVAAPYYAVPAPYFTPNYTPLYTEPYVAPYGEAIYVEQTSSPPALEQPSTGLSYYCASSNAYYPNVRSCPEGWQQARPDPAMAFLNALRAR